ncbi:MAG: DUF748 domain-containing protein, partial [Deltaproteobacteria bacterium]|nr:DUF748 domain-containing protein [Deltaproteobacteria bacterium]
LDLAPPAAGATHADPAGRPSDSGAAFDLRVDAVRVESARVVFVDRAPRGGFQTTLSDIDLSVEQFSLASGADIVYRLALKTEAGEDLALEGGLSLDPVETGGTVRVGNIELAKYTPYAGDLPNFEIQKGRLSVQSRFRFRAGDPSPELILSEGGLSIDSLALYRREQDEKVVSIPKLALEGVSFSLAGRDLRIGQVRTEGGAVHFRRYPDGRINLADLVNLPAGAEKAGAAPPEKSEPFLVTVDSLGVKDYQVWYEDQVPVEPVSAIIKPLNLEAENISTRPGETVGMLLTLKGPKGGAGKIEGKAKIDPLEADLKIDVKKVDVRPFQPYFTDRVKIIVTGGTVSTDGHLVLRSAAGSDPRFRYTGTAQVNGFSSVDKEDALEFVKWASLYLKGMNVQTTPLSVDVEEVGLSSFYSRFIIDEDGSINVSDVVAGGAEEGGAGAQAKAEDGKEPPAKKASAKETVSGPGPRINIHIVTLQDGHINFTDRFNPFHFHGNLTDIGGRVSGFSSLETERAEVLLKGRWEKHAPLEIKGEINPLAEKRYADLTVTIRDIDLSPFSPYSGRFLGYKLQKGLLTLELGYLLEGTRLKGDNRALFKDLTLGERVDSKDAVSIPVGLAISLLKDLNGQITLDVPVEGDLNDPQFSLGRTILRVIGNLIVKIVTAPFAWIGNMVGGEEDLSFVDFAPGSVEITDEAREKLSALIEALEKRPNLDLEIRGDADPRGDPEAMRKEKFQNLLKSQKLKEMTASGRTAVPLDQVAISDEEYPRYLKKAYDAADFAKPRGADGKIKELSPEEMEKLLLTQFFFVESDLRNLAMERADLVKTELLSTGRVESDRLFIVAPKIMDFEPKEDKDAGKSRVCFSLK